MYIQITTRCNMSCAHCCFSCTEDGEDMSVETLKNALKWGDEVINIGGGEPTLHPQFFEILCLALAAGNVWMATNGSTPAALTLAKMAKAGILGVALSQDEWHDDIDVDVVEAFTYNSKLKDDRREIRNVYYNVHKAGRAEDFGIYTTEETCACDDLFVKPNGDVYGCGCEGAVYIGNVNDPDFEPQYFEGCSLAQNNSD